MFLKKDRMNGGLLSDLHKKQVKFSYAHKRGRILIRYFKTYVSLVLRIFTQIPQSGLPGFRIGYNCHETMALQTRNAHRKPCVYARLPLPIWRRNRA